MLTTTYNAGQISELADSGLKTALKSAVNDAKLLKQTVFVYKRIGAEEYKQKLAGGYQLSQFDVSVNWELQGVVFPA